MPLSLASPAPCHCWPSSPCCLSPWSTLVPFLDQKCTSELQTRSLCTHPHGQPTQTPLPSPSASSIESSKLTPRAWAMVPETGSRPACRSTLRVQHPPSSSFPPHRPPGFLQSLAGRPRIPPGAVSCSPSFGNFQHACSKFFQIRPCGSGSAQSGSQPLLTSRIRISLRARHSARRLLPSH
jgi:hypothetical protein